MYLLLHIQYLHLLTPLTTITSCGGSSFFYKIHQVWEKISSLYSIKLDSDHVTETKTTFKKRFNVFAARFQDEEDK
jgi:hypothetical protein